MTIPKSLASILSGAALCASLAACTSPQAPEGPELPEQTTTASVDLSAGDVFLTAARATAPELEYVDDATLTDLWPSVCGAFEAGASTSMIGYTMIQSGLDATASGAVVGAATASLCPEYEDAARGQ